MDNRRSLRKNKVIFFLLGFLTAVVLMLAGVVVGGSYYMVDYALAPNTERGDTARRFAWLYESYPETRPWVDSLRRAEALREGIRSVKFVEDCGYTSVWDEFSYEMADEFGLSDFPLLYTSSLLCGLKYGWRFGEASPLRQVAKCRQPMLFIHGDNDYFVPSWMVHPLYEAKSADKQLWVSEGTEHALSYKDYPGDYARRLRDFLEIVD